MYQGTNPKALQSMRQIDDALMRLLESTSYSDISITALCREAGVSRPTFYKNYDGMEDVVVHILKQLFGRIPTIDDADAAREWRDCLHSSIQMFSENLTLLRLVHDNDLQDIFMRELSVVSRRVLDVSEIDRQLREYLVSYYAGGLTSLLMFWCTQSDPLDCESVCQMVDGLFAGMPVFVGE